MLKNLLKVQPLTQTTIRNHGQHNKKHIYKNGEKFANNYYYPRYDRLFYEVM